MNLTVLKLLNLLRQWIARRWFAKGVEVGKAQQRAEDAVSLAEQEHRRRQKIIRERLHAIHKAQEEEASWKERHGFK